MYGSCTFNSVKYNSNCIKEVVVTPTPPEGAEEKKIRRVKRRLLVREFITIVGKKLISQEQRIPIVGKVLSTACQNINLKGSYLLNKQVAFLLKGNSLNKVSTSIVLKGKVQHFISTKQTICGKTQIPLNHFYIFVKGKRLIPSLQVNIIKGTKLVFDNRVEKIKGTYMLPCKQNCLIKGRKDISEILEALEIDYLEKE